MNYLVIQADQGKQRINKNVYGHFAEHLGRCIYEGIWVGEDSSIPNTRGIRNDVVEALCKIHVPVLRWPGGCFADEYHWRDGVGPRQERPATVNTHWGALVENNDFGTHEFFDLCEMIGTQPYICGNVGSGTVQEMEQWVEYMTYAGSSPMANLRRKNGREQPWQLPYFGVGNENWGCGGSMRPEYYADLYRRYQSYVRNLSGNKIFKIACGPNAADYNWTEVVMREAGRYMHGFGMHYYTRHREESWDSKGPATGFDEQAWFRTLHNCLHTEELIRRHSTIMDHYDPDKHVALLVDEWGTWFDVEPGTNPAYLYQQNTMRDALVAGLSLNIFNNHCDRVQMANLAQTVNVLQALILTDGPAMLTTPTYHVFDLYQAHQEALLLPCFLESDVYTHDGRQMPQVNVSASHTNDGKVLLTLCNVDPHKEAEVDCTLQGVQVSEVSGMLLASEEMGAHNTFENPQRVKPVASKEVRFEAEKATIVLPPMSVSAYTISLTLEK